MSASRELSVAESSQVLARKYSSQNDFGRAFCHYLVVLNLRPEWKSTLEDEFTSALCNWGLILEKKGKFDDIMHCYEQAINIYTHNVTILNNFGAHLLRYNLLKEAKYYFNKCLSLKPNFLKAQQNMDNLANLAVERWHFRMLNDVNRNEAFRQAIIKKIQQGYDRVLDIGTGTGLLSLFCVEGKAREIYACESADVMVETAKMVFRGNGVESIKLINKHSTQLLVPSDIPEKLSLVVTETFDSGLLGEGALTSLCHAWKNLLLPPRFSSGIRSANVIPLAGQLYVAAIECDFISKRFYGNAPKVIFPANGFINSDLTYACDNYDTQDLTLVSFKYLTNVKKLPLINFNDPSNIEDILAGHSDRELELTCSESGRLDCFAVWFDLILDEDIVLNTGPYSQTNDAWEQAIFTLPKNLFVEKGQEISIQVSFLDGKLSISHLVKNLGSISHASQTLIKILNDLTLTESLIEIKNKLSVVFDRPVHVMDWFPFPVFGLAFLITRANRFKDKLTCFISSEHDEFIIRLYAKQYGFENDVVIERECSIENYRFMKKEFDVIVLNFVESTGEIKENCCTYLKHIRELLKPDGMLIPSEVTVMGQFVHSEWLLKASKVLNDQRTCGYKVAEYINNYKVRHFIDFDAGIDKVNASNPFPLFSISDQEVSFDIDIPLFSNAPSINAMIYWFKIKFAKNSQCVFTNGELSAFNLSAFIFLDIDTTNRETLKCHIFACDGLFKVQLL